MILAVLLSLATALLPPIGGIAPPDATELVAMDVAVGGKAGSSPVVYRIASPLLPKVFRAAYAAAARRAGYETVSSARIVTGKRPTGDRFRLVLQPRATGSTGVLTVMRE
jgi:hypothetical protein